MSTQQQVALSARQRRIVEMVKAGESHAHMAQALGCSIATVSRELRRLRDLAGSGLLKDEGIDDDLDLMRPGISYRGMAAIASHSFHGSFTATETAPGHSKSALHRQVRQIRAAKGEVAEEDLLRRDALMARNALRRMKAHLERHGRAMEVTPEIARIFGEIGELSRQVRFEAGGSPDQDVLFGTVLSRLKAAFPPD